MTTLVAHSYSANGGVNSITQSVNATGGDYLRVWVYAEGAVSVTSISRASQTPTLVTGSNTGAWLGCYQLVAPATGASNLTVTLSGTSARFLVYYSVWSGVNASTPSRAVAINSFTAQTTIPLNVPSNAGDIIEAVCMAGTSSMTLDTSAGAVQIEDADNWLSAGRSFGAASEDTEDATVTWTPVASATGTAVGIPIIASGSPAPTITSVDSDNTITSTQTGWNVVGTDFSTAAVAIIQGSTTVSQTVNSQNATTINCDTVFDAAVGADLKYGAASLRVTNADTQQASIAIAIAVPSGRSYIDILTPDPVASNRITAVPDIASGDQLEISNVIGGTIGDVNVYDDATFDCALAVTAFSVRCWAASDSTWGSIGVQTVTGDTGDAPTFVGTIPTQNFTQNVSIGSVDFSPYFTDVSSYSLNQALPTGLSFNTTSGALTGTPTVSGTFGGFIITATNPYGTAASNAFTISIASNQSFTSGGGRKRDRRNRGFLNPIFGRG